MNTILIGGLILDDSPFKDLMSHYTDYQYFDINHTTLEHLQAELIKTINSLDNVLVIAYSTGGLILLSIYEHIKQKNIKLILINSTPFFMEDTNWAGIKYTDYTNLKNKLNQSNLDTFKQYFSTLSSYPYKRHEISSSANSQHYIALWLEFIKNTDLRELISNITTPLLIINSEHDIIAKHNLLITNKYIKSKLLTKSSHSILNNQELINTITEFTHV